MATAAPVINLQGKGHTDTNVFSDSKASQSLMKSVSHQRKLQLAFTAFAALALAVSTGSGAETSQRLPRADGGSTPVRDYSPSGNAPCAPTMVISHGFGGDESAFASLAMSMSASGWRVIAMSHLESGRKPFRRALLGGGGLAAIDTAARRRPLHAARFLDLDAAYAAAMAKCRPPVLILAGHSMGAQTTIMEAGGVPLIGKMGNDRFDAYIALSPQGIGTTFATGAWSGIRKPVLMITGTRDKTADHDYTSRLAAFDGLPGGRKRLAVIPRAGHLAIGQIGSPKVRNKVTALVLEFAEQIATKNWRASTIEGVEIFEK
jgi:pimeloyl-ACP methyl ester carboxylesterase